MAETTKDLERRNLPVLTGQSVLSQMAWTMGSPSVVLPFLAVSLEMPMFLAGILVSVRKVGSLIGDVFLAGSVAAQARKKRGVALTELVIGASILLAVVAAALGGQPMIALAFVVAFFIIGLTEEVQGLMLIDLVGDHLGSRSRMWRHYLQLGIGGMGAIALTLIVHEMTRGNPPLTRHSAVLAIAATCFVFSALSILALREMVPDEQPRQESDAKPRRSVINTLRTFVADARALFAESWFRRYILMRTPLVAVALAVPFFALLAAEAHHSSTRGLTALIVSSASGYLVAAPLWQVVNMKSHRAVMVTGCLLIAATGSVLVGTNVLGIDHQVHLHAAALFVATVAATGVSGARHLYFMDVAPKAQRVKAAAVIKTISRFLAVVLSAALAAVAHMHEVVMAVLFIVLASLAGAVLCYRIVTPQQQAGTAPQP